MSVKPPRSRLRLRALERRVQSPHTRATVVLGAPRSSAGQSVTEFALVVPFLLIILLTVADFGRYFAASLNVESIARTAAEVSAQEYLRAGTTDYAAIHGYAWQSVCDEAKGLPNVTYNGPATECDGIPTEVCVHDSVDPSCATTYNAGGGVPPECSVITDPISNAQTGGSELSKYVEVRVCYRFSTVFGFSIPFLGGDLTTLSGNFYIQKIRTFTVADY
ncbi:MAG: pilus assembly protein [Chloroflexota bacterium]|nr:MAG: pilus assembly protein [Chloroflexota bacterium]